jgi:uncharacterized protein YecT (DUF1311 family)
LGKGLSRLVVLIAAGALSFSACSAGTSAKRPTSTTTTAAALMPPLIENGFTSLPCDENTTIGRTGCALEEVKALDRQANEVIKDVFAGLGSDDARRRFIRAEESWQAYRRDTCESRSDLFEGGSEAGAERARCMAAESRRHLDDLTAYRNRR